ncbi:hypothetical protein Aph02nite_49940 [Actinoplanes philippinensis]|nr:hypothetical protein Aph02nite_49940 [Actinoplanes philippinensis]
MFIRVLAVTSLKINSAVRREPPPTSPTTPAATTTASPLNSEEPYPPVLDQGAAQARRGPDALGLPAGSSRHRPAHRPVP